MNVPEQNEVDHSLEDEKKTTPSQVILQSLQSLPSLLFLRCRRDAHFLPRRDLQCLFAMFSSILSLNSFIAKPIRQKILFKHTVAVQNTSIIIK